MSLTESNRFFRKQVYDENRETRMASCCHCKDEEGNPRQYVVFCEAKALTAKQREVRQSILAEYRDEHDIQTTVKNVNKEHGKHSTTRNVVIDLFARFDSGDFNLQKKPCFRVHSVISHLIKSCTKEAIVIANAGTLLDRGRDKFDKRFKGPKKPKLDEDAEALVLAQLISDEADESNPTSIEIAVTEALPNVVKCACGQEFNKLAGFVTLLRGHFMNFCPVFESLRSLLFELIMDEEFNEFIIPNVTLLNPFTYNPPEGSRPLLYLHYRTNEPILWVDLFLRFVISYFGVIIKRKRSDGRDGFDQRKALHIHTNNLSTNTEAMLPVFEGEEPEIRLLEAVCQALLNVNCSLKNNQVESIPLIGRTEKELEDAVKTLASGIRALYNQLAQETGTEQLKLNRRKFKEAEMKKILAREE